MVSEQRTTPEQRKALRARYTPEPVPTCAYCHRGPMVRIPPQPMDAHRYVHWGCPHDNYGTVTSAGEPEIIALLDDADALAGALAECERLRRALGNVGGGVSFAYNCLEGDGDSKAERMLARIGEMVDAALAPQSDQAS